MHSTGIALNKLLVTSLLLGMFALLLLPPGGVGALSLAPRCGQWSIVASPNTGSMDILTGIAAISPHDVWAVGSYIDTQGSHQPLIEHWNGKRWNLVKSSNPGSTDSYLLGIVAVSAKDVWAVGTTSGVTSSGALIEHWDGANWRVVPNPGVGTLYGVSALSSTDVWAVGSDGRTVIEHWNGRRWSVIKSPNPGQFGDRLAAVAAISPTDVWAVGDDAAKGISDQPLVEHWNGKQWRAIKSPSLGRFASELRAVSAVAANDIWATGYDTAPPGDITLTLAEHWNGTMWSVVKSPSPTGDDLLEGVVALSTSDVFAVGSRSSADQNLVLQWNGTSWNIVPTPYRRGASSIFSAVSADSATDIWAAGTDLSKRNYAFHTLIEHDCSP